MVNSDGSVRNEITGGIIIGTVVQGRDIRVQLPPQVPAALSGLRPADSAFVGRDEELAALMNVLDPRGRHWGPKVAVVAGLAGVGKTELAVQAAHAALGRGWFAGGVLFVDLYGYDPARRVSPTAALESLLRALGVPPEHIPTTPQDRGRLYTSVLAEFAKQARAVLVVVDNVFDAEQARPLISPVGTILTSRHNITTLNAALHVLEEVSPPDAVTLLRRALGVIRRGDSRVVDAPEAAEEIAELCGHLPLALRIVAALLAKLPNRQLAGMAEDLRQERHRLQELEVESWAVRAAFDLSYRHLTPEEARAFRLMSLNPGPDVSDGAVAVLAECDLRAARRRARDLAGRSRHRRPAPVRGTVQPDHRPHDAGRGLLTTEPCARPDRPPQRLLRGLTALPQGRCRSVPTAQTAAPDLTHTPQAPWTSGPRRKVKASETSSPPAFRRDRGSSPHNTPRPTGATGHPRPTAACRPTPPRGSQTRCSNTGSRSHRPSGSQSSCRKHAAHGHRLLPDQTHLPRPDRRGGAADTPSASDTARPSGTFAYDASMAKIRNS
jgi:hypothetical protein